MFTCDTQGFGAAYRRKNNLPLEGKTARSTTPVVRVGKYGHMLGAFSRASGLPSCGRTHTLISQIQASPRAKLVLLVRFGDNSSMATGKVKLGASASGRK